MTQPDWFCLYALLSCIGWDVENYFDSTIYDLSLHIHIFYL